jgi:hypothetical protein
VTLHNPDTTATVWKGTAGVIEDPQVGVVDEGADDRQGAEHGTEHCDAEREGAREHVLGFPNDLGRVPCTGCDRRADDRDRRSEWDAMWAWLAAAMRRGGRSAAQ